MASRVGHESPERRSPAPDVKVRVRLIPSPVSPNEIRIVLDALGAELALLFKDEAG